MAVQGIKNEGSVLEIYTVPQNEDLTEAQFAALSGSWEEICCVSTQIELGIELEVLSEHCMSGVEITGTGARTGSEADLEVFYFPDCEGQTFLRSIIGDGNSYAIRKTYSNATTTTTASIVYARVFPTSFSDGGGGVDDFVTHTFGMKLTQDPIFVDPAPIP